ncbi:hypothetical protein LOTGIDRAFT_165901 [Lottia gigantea]|uniref:THAP-type domain-containing protein n=1 Tax=Lottia gigantea TaxID=225164 RepID=V3ZZR2_LOTGI|nr:hypothetical protein LOTGIDRAFT_165901 [Lottia gigantea]ESO88160.1 hypothetical protein LOTGIDRAFT_165901 [Lottia gigantea]
MVKTCCVYKCHNRFNVEAKSRGISFFRFPKNKRQRNAWIKAVNRKDWLPNNNTWICSEHFLDGWHGYEPTDGNYSPTIFAYKETEKNVSQVARESRHLVREKSQETLHAEKLVRQQYEIKQQVSLFHHSSYCMEVEENPGNDEMCDLDVMDSDVELPSLKKTVGTQCDTGVIIEENNRLKEELKAARMELEKEKWSVSKIADNDGLTKFYTGLPTFDIFLWLFTYLQDKCSRMSYWTGENAFEIPFFASQHQEMLARFSVFDPRLQNIEQGDRKGMR